MEKLYTIRTIDGRFYNRFFNSLVDRIDQNCIYSIGDAGYYMLLVEKNIKADIHEVEILIK